MKMFFRATALAAALMLVGSLAGCSGGGNDMEPNSTTGTQELSGTLTVFAAASLKSTFTQLAKEFQAAHPGVKVSLDFDGSSTLVTQIVQGAPADVFASADQANMKKLVDATLVLGTPVVFATNFLTLVVPPNNPANITSFADASRPDVKLVICAPQVPCGAAAQADAKAASLTLKPVSEELNVTSVLGKVTSGEADAGLVYVTDAKTAAQKVQTIPLNLTGQTTNRYPIAAVSSSKQQEAAKAFIALVTGAQGQKILQDSGFGAP